MDALASHEISWSLFFQNAIRTVYRETKYLFGLAVTRGWRPLIGFAGAYMMWGIAWRVAHGMPLPNVAEILAAVVPTLGMAVLRTFEKNAGVAGFPQLGAGAGARGPGVEPGRL